MIHHVFAEAVQGGHVALPHSYQAVRLVLSSDRYSREEKQGIADEARRLALGIDPKWSPVSQLLLVNLKRDFPDFFVHSDTADNLECSTFSTLKAMVQCGHTAKGVMRNLKTFSVFLMENQLEQLAPIIEQHEQRRQGGAVQPIVSAYPVYEVPAAF